MKPNANRYRIIRLLGFLACVGLFWLLTVYRLPNQSSPPEEYAAEEPASEIRVDDAPADVADSRDDSPTQPGAGEGSIDASLSTEASDDDSASQDSSPDASDSAGVPADGANSGRPETTYTAPDLATLEPGTPAAQAFSLEADAAVSEAGTDADLPRHVGEEVLLSVPEGTTLAGLEVMLEGIDFVSLESACESDLEMGFVVLPLAEGMSVSEAAARLQCVDGIEYAEPNLILTLADDIANPAAFARILDPTTSLRTAAVIGDELSQELAELVAGGEEPAEPTDEAEEPAEETSMEPADPMEDAAGTADVGDETGADTAGEPADGEPQGSEAIDDPGDVQLEEGDPTADGVEALNEDLAAAADPYMPNDPMSGESSQWALGSVNAYQAWALARCERKVGIALIDTGALISHEDLAANIIPEYYNSETQSTDASSVADGKGHGTHVAGIASAVTDNELGVAGTSYNARLLVIKASQGDTDQFSVDSVIRAIGWLLSKPAGSSQTRAEQYNIRVINFSVAVRDSGGWLQNASDSLLAKIQEAHDAGILMVCAAGNGASDGAYACYPGDYESVLSVINVRQREPGSSAVLRVDGSNYNVGAEIIKDVSAPGTSILSTSSGGEYEQMSGTSMAAPCVAGVAALMFAADPGLTPGDIVYWLEKTANIENCANYSTTEYGYGEVDAYAAVLALKTPHVSGEVSLHVGESATYAITAGSRIVEGDWVWSSSNPSVATISSDGVLTALSAGKTTITATDTAGDAAAHELEVTVTQWNLSSAAVTLSATSYTFDGAAKKPGVTVTLDGRTVPSSAYTVTYSNSSPTSIGTYTVTVTGTGAYTGSVKKTFTITGRSLASATVTLAQTEYAYDGKAKTPAATVKLGNTTLRQGTDYTVAYTNNKAAGTATVTITGKGNYAGTAKKTFSIVKCSISGSATMYVGFPIKLTASPSRRWAWKVSNTAVATINSAGQLTAKKSGTVTVTATSGGLTVSKTVTVADAAYFIYGVGSGKVLNVASNSTKSGANVQIYSLNRLRTQRWRLEYKNGHYVVRNVGSNMVLEVAGASTKNKANVRQAAYTGKNGQLWDLVARKGGGYELVNVASKKALDVSGGSKQNGANVQQYTRNNSAGQGWRFTRITGAVTNGTYRISSTLNANFVVDLKGGSTANGAAIQLYRWNGYSNQKWKITYEPRTGYYIITSAKTGRAIDVTSGRNANGIKLQQYARNSSWAQRWDIRKNSNGTYTFYSAVGGRAMDVSGSKAKNGARLQTWTSNSSKDQRWRLAKV